jgi:hypothetical protein
MWVPVRGAADRLNVSEDTIRRRLKASALNSRRESTPSGFRWLVELPDAIPAPPMQAPAPDSNHAPADAQAGEVTVLRELVEVLKGNVTTLTAELAARSRDVDQLTILLQRAQERQALTQPAGAGAQAGRRQRLQQRSWWRRLLGWA